jgi:ATP-binding cassette, subfamily B, bacterial HlyB/CyaB
LRAGAEAARAISAKWARLPKVPVPALVECRDGGFLILGRVVDDKVLVQDPAVGGPQLMERAEFESRWSGRLILITRRASLGDLAKEFNITWFLQAIPKYRWILSEVLIASFFLQLFALVSPIFFQVVIDKVLVHRGLTTLDVLIFGLLVVSIFECVLGALRTIVSSARRRRLELRLRLCRRGIDEPIETALMVRLEGPPCAAAHNCALSAPDFVRTIAG